jgi:hypothetical protein
MIETIQINWLLLAAPFLWTLGIAVIVTLLTLMHFSKAATGLKYQDFIKKPLSRIGVLIGAGLIISGFLLNFARIPSHQLIVVKLGKQKPIPLKPVSTDPVHFSPQELKMDAHNKSHILNNEKMKDNTMVLFWDGYIETPFLQFKPVEYTVEFQAEGSRAEEEYSQIKVEFEIPDKNNYLVTTFRKYIELTGKMEPYRMIFNVESDTMGRIRITYFNDVYIPETGTGRDVRLKNLTIRKNNKI